MNKYNKEQIAEVWIKRYLDLNEKESTQFAYNYLHNLTSRDSKEALEIIFTIYEMTDNEFVLDNLAAGPLEDLLARNGGEVIDDIERYIEINNKFCCVLSGIWEGNITPNILKRIDELIDKYGSD